MSTIDRINLEGAEAIEKLKRGEKLTPNEKEIVKIYTSLHAGKAGNAGKRKVIRTGK